MTGNFLRKYADSRVLLPVIDSISCNIQTDFNTNVNLTLLYRTQRVTNAVSGDIGSSSWLTYHRILLLIKLLVWDILYPSDVDRKHVFVGYVFHVSHLTWFDIPMRLIQRPDDSDCCDNWRYDTGKKEPEIYPVFASAYRQFWSVQPREHKKDDQKPYDPSEIVCSVQHLC